MIPHSNFRTGLKSEAAAVPQKRVRKIWDPGLPGLLKRLLQRTSTLRAANSIGAAVAAKALKGRIVVGLFWSMQLLATLAAPKAQNKVSGTTTFSFYFVCLPRWGRALKYLKRSWCWALRWSTGHAHYYYEARLLAPGASNYCLWRLRTWTMRGGAAVAAKACIGEFRWSLHPGPTQVNKVNGKVGNGLGTCRTGDYFGRKGHFLSRWVVGWYERRLIGGDKGDGSVGSVDALKCQSTRGLMKNYYMDGWVGQPSPPPWVVLGGGFFFW